MKVVALLTTDGPICVDTYANNPALARFTLREAGVTVAVGKITKLVPRNESDVAASMAALSVDA